MIRLAFLGCGKIAKAHAKRLRRHRARRRGRLREPRRRRAREAYARELGGTAHGTLRAGARVAPRSTRSRSSRRRTRTSSSTLRALAAGKHVVLEKPPLAARGGLRARSPMPRRPPASRCSSPRTTSTSRCCAACAACSPTAQIGDVLFIHVNAIKKQRDAGWRTDPALTLGGALYEGGIHWIDFMASLGSPGARASTACGRSRRRRRSSAR